MQGISDSKNSPNTRRHAAGQTRYPSKKVYASESDVPSHQPHGEMRSSPSTPRKSLSGGGVPQQGSATTTQKQQRNRTNNKNRNPKNGAVSPGHRQQQDRRSPAVFPKETSAPIFAGSTFHASPAPTSLPIPSFLGRSNSDGVTHSDTEAVQDASPQSVPDESPTAKAAPRRHDESPLEFFFRADRAEKARVRRASSANTGAPSDAPFSAPPITPSEYNSSPRGVADGSAHRLSSRQRNTSPGMSTSEIDGNSRLPFGPAFSTPYQERIRAARSSQSAGAAQPKPMVNRTMDLNSSEALKRYLFTGQLNKTEPNGTSPAYSSSTPERTARFPESSSQNTQQPQSPFSSQVSQHTQYASPNRSHGGFRPPVLASYTTQTPPGAPALAGYMPHVQHGSPTTNNHTPNAQPAVPSKRIHSDPSPRPEHIIALEGDLRRLLNLDSLG